MVLILNLIHRINTDYLIEFDSANLSFDNLSLNDLNSVSLEKGLGYVQISGYQDLDYSLSFSAKDLTSEKFTLKILKENREDLKGSFCFKKLIFLLFQKKIQIPPTFLHPNCNCSN